MSNPSTNPGAFPSPDMSNAHLQVLALANELARRAKNQMILGASLAGGGIVLTLVTYADAKPGGQYAIFWGLILVGLIRFGTAAKRHSTARNDAIAHFQDQQVAPSPEPHPVAPEANPVANAHRPRHRLCINTASRCCRHRAQARIRCQATDPPPSARSAAALPELTMLGAAAMQANGVRGQGSVRVPVSAMNDHGALPRRSPTPPPAPGLSPRRRGALVGGTSLNRRTIFSTMDVVGTDRPAPPADPAASAGAGVRGTGAERNAATSTRAYVGHFGWTRVRLVRDPAGVVNSLPHRQWFGGGLRHCGEDVVEADPERIRELANRGGGGHAVGGLELRDVRVRQARWPPPDRCGSCPCAPGPAAAARRAPCSRSSESPPSNALLA